MRQISILVDDDVKRAIEHGKTDAGMKQRDYVNVVLRKAFGLEPEGDRACASGVAGNSGPSTATNGARNASRRRKSKAEQKKEAERN